MNKPYFEIDAYRDYPEVVAAHSLRDPERPAEFSMLPFNTDEDTAAKNRDEFKSFLGFSRLAAPKLTHGDTIYELTDDYSFETRPEADAIMTDKKGVLIGVGVADCIVVLLHDPEHKAIAAVHSGWRGSLANISGKAIHAMSDLYGTDPGKLIAYVSPAPQRFEYGLLSTYATQFDDKYCSPKSPTDSWYDNKLQVFDQLLGAGLNSEHVTIDPRSNYGLEFHSYRRDREKSGRHMAVIGLK